MDRHEEQAGTGHEHGQCGGGQERSCGAEAQDPQSAASLASRCSESWRT